MPRLIPRLARLSVLPTLPTSRAIPLLRPALSLLNPTKSRSLSSRPFLPSTTPNSIFTPSRSSILSRLPTSPFQPQYTQIRTLAYGTTYQPSQRKRKRKYGFLARLKGGRLGQAILARRRIRGRRFLSH